MGSELPNALLEKNNLHRHTEREGKVNIIFIISKPAAGSKQIKDENYRVLLKNFLTRRLQWRPAWGSWRNLQEPLYKIFSAWKWLRKAIAGVTKSERTGGI